MGIYHGFWDISDWTKVVDRPEGIKKTQKNKTQNTETVAEEHHSENPEDSLTLRNQKRRNLSRKNIC